MKKVMIIGASSGMGRAVAERFAQNGYLVMITGRREDLLAAIREQHPGRILISAFDVTNLAQLASNLENSVQVLGGMDLLLISAGGGDLNEELDFDTEKRMIDLNVSAFTLAAGWGFRYFRKQGHGHLAAISSIAGLRGLRHSPGYNACKAYQVNYLEGLRQKSRHLGLPLTVTDIRPGFVDTPNAKGKGRFWQASVSRAAGQIVHALEKGRKVAYITKRWRLIAQAMKIAPRGWYERL